MKKRVLSVILALIMLLSGMSLAGASVTATDTTTSSYHWVASWTTSPIKTGLIIAGVRLCDFLSNCCYRTVIQMTLGGTQVRLKFSNLYGDDPIVLDETNIARTSVNNESDIIKGSIIPVTFDGKTKATIPAGGEIYCDPIDMDVSALEYLSITTYVSDRESITTAGFYGGTSYMEYGNRLEQESFTSMSPLLFTSGAITYHIIPFLCAAEVMAPADNYSVVFFGDSTITNQSPYYLAERLQRSGVQNVGVAQQAIIANKVLNDGEGNSIYGNIYGIAAIKRFDTDVLEVAGVKKVFIKIGVNDVIHPRCKSMEGKVPYVTADEIMEGYQLMIDKAHSKGIEVYFFSRTAWKGYNRSFGLTSNEPDAVWSQEAEDILLDLNSRLKQLADDGGIEGYIDLDFLRDPEDSTKLKDEYTSDGAHLTELGARLLTDAIPYTCFGSTPLLSINDLYLSGRGGESVTTPFTPVTTSVEKSNTTTKSSSTSGTTSASSGDTDSPGTTASDTNNTSTTKPIETITATQGEVQTRIITVTLPTTEPLVAPEPEKTMDKGTVTGIVIVAVLLIGAVSFMTVYFVNKKKMTD